jgi:hypothetical protein
MDKAIRDNWERIVTRQPSLIAEKSPRKLVDKRVNDPLRWKQEGADKAGEGGIKIHEDVWAEFVLVAKYLVNTESDPEIADIFEFFRIHDYDGEAYSPSLLKRVTREVETECGPF